MDEPTDRPPLAQAWSQLGVTNALELDAIELVRADIPLIAPVTTSVGTHRHRPLVLLHLTGHRPDGTTVEGWGECAALADTTYDEEDVGTASSALEKDLVPAFAHLVSERGILPPVADLAGLPHTPGRPLAFAALEMALADVHLRGSGRSFADLLGVNGQRVEPGAVLGLPHSAGQLAADIERLRTDGYVRVKIKIAPGSEALVDRVLRPLQKAGLLVQLDANGSYGADAADRFRVLDDLGLACIEQPLRRDDLDGHRRLASALVTPICLDESLDSPAAVVAAVETGASSVVCVKPARLGGIGAALDVIDWCVAREVPWWIGGMFESGFARGANRTLASLPGRSLPGDLAAPSTYLVADLVDPTPGRIDRRSGRLALPLPSGPGLGPAPDPGLLEPWLVRRVTLSTSALRPGRRGFRRFG